MSKNPQLFADELAEVLHLYKAKSRKNLEILRDELAYAVSPSRNGSYLEFLGKGNAPSDLRDLENLVKELVQQSRRYQFLTHRHCERLLRYGGHPHWQDMAAQLSGTTESAIPFVHKAFVVGPPIQHPRQFFGRNRELKRIFGGWRGIPFSHFAILGKRRSGKTSLLNYLKTICTTSVAELRPIQKNDWLPNAAKVRWVYVDFQDPTLQRLDGLLPYILQGMGETVSKTPNLVEFIATIKQSGWQHPTIILFDELEGGLSAPELDRPFWQSLRSLINLPGNQIAFVVSAQHSPALLADNQGKTSPFFNIFSTLQLGPLIETEAIELLNTSPQSIPMDDMTWILAESERWPYLLQILCEERRIALENDDNSEQWKHEGKRRIQEYRQLYG